MSNSGTFDSNNNSLCLLYSNNLFLYDLARAILFSVLNKLDNLFVIKRCVIEHRNRHYMFILLSNTKTLKNQYNEY